MKTFGILALLLILIVIGGFSYVAMTDVPVVQTTLTHDLPSDLIQ